MMEVCESIALVCTRRLFLDQLFEFSVFVKFGLPCNVENEGLLKEVLRHDMFHRFGCPWSRYWVSSDSLFVFSSVAPVEVRDVTQTGIV